MAVAQLYHHCAPRSEVGTVARALMRLLHNHRCVLLLWWLSERICRPYFYVFCFVFMCCFSVHCSDTELVSRTTCVSQQQKCKPFWIVIKQEVMGWQWCRLERVQTICISLQTDNHVCTSWQLLCGLDALPDAQSTVSQHCGQLDVGLFDSLLTPASRCGLHLTKLLPFIHRV